jgi:hypothetical protein
MTRIPLIACAALSASCSGWLFSGYDKLDQTQPVALIETTGGVELAATTEFGILTLGRTAQEGPCRVHYFLGPTPMVEDGSIKPTGSVFCRADMDLKTQHLRVLDRAVSPEDELLAMWTADGVAVQTVNVQIARAEGVEGDVLNDPGQDLPAGASLFVKERTDLRFVGLVAGKASFDGAPGAGSFYVYAGVNRIREMLAVPEVYPTEYETKFRLDDITVRKPIQPTPGK